MVANELAIVFGPRLWAVWSLELLVAGCFMLVSRLRAVSSTKFAERLGAAGGGSVGVMVALFVDCGNQSSVVVASLATGLQ
jgi:hypothetical protein